MPNAQKQKKEFCIYNCKAWCCRNLIFFYNGGDDQEEMIKFFSLRGLIYNPTDKTVIVPSKCKWLTTHNKCKLYSWRTSICRNYECDKLKNLEPLHYIR